MNEYVVLIHVLQSVTPQIWPGQCRVELYGGSGQREETLIYLLGVLPLQPATIFFKWLWSINLSLRHLGYIL